MIRILLHENTDEDFKVCVVCGDSICDPYQHDGLITCSGCDAERALEARKRHLLRDHLAEWDVPPPICLCGKLYMTECDAGNCKLPDLKPAKSGQMKLFEEVTK